MKPYLTANNLRIVAPSGRLLFDQLCLQLGREQVALVGRNGVGKSTLLACLAGAYAPEAGRIVAESCCLVPQILDQDGSGSPGQLRRAALAHAFASGARVLLLDEPTEDLDAASVTWLVGQLRASRAACVVVTHDPRLLAMFGSFLVVDERGGYVFAGTYEALEQRLTLAEREHDQRYVKDLRRLVEHEERMLHIARRKARKKRYGRASEIDRATPRIRLNAKRGQAQVNHGKCAEVRQARVAAMRAWAHAARKALAITMPLDLAMPTLPPIDDEVSHIIRAEQLRAVVAGRTLFHGLTISVSRERIAVVGGNGSGKSTLLAMLTQHGANERTLGAGPHHGANQRTQHVHTAGMVRCDHAKLGVILQGGCNWQLSQTLAELLGDEAAIFAALHNFPLALALRPLASLSPGERTRAALIAMLHRPIAPEVLVLDEPTFALDQHGRRGLIAALAAWKGGLVVASHDRAFIDAIGVDGTIELPTASAIAQPATFALGPPQL
ncbi:MAG TPA: ATP-binding cassette domain-containing protein [Kofleriaceae bacterium]|nr:ATP-binding cassette domain-containing protein [Kofleriaceae bacterium]